MRGIWKWCKREGRKSSSKWVSSSSPHYPVNNTLLNWSSCRVRQGGSNFESTCSQWLVLSLGATVLLFPVLITINKHTPLCHIRLSPTSSSSSSIANYQIQRLLCLCVLKQWNWTLRFFSSWLLQSVLFCLHVLNLIKLKIRSFSRCCCFCSSVIRQWWSRWSESCVKGVCCFLLLFCTVSLCVCLSQEVLRALGAKSVDCGFICFSVCCFFPYNYYCLLGRRAARGKLSTHVWERRHLVSALRKLLKIDKFFIIFSLLERFIIWVK